MVRRPTATPSAPVPPHRSRTRSRHRSLPALACLEAWHRLDAARGPDDQRGLLDLVTNQRRDPTVQAARNRRQPVKALRALVVLGIGQAVVRLEPLAVAELLLHALASEVEDGNQIGGHS